MAKEGEGLLILDGSIFLFKYFFMGTMDNKVKHIGLLGGTFNPVTVGHIELAKSVIYGTNLTYSPRINSGDSRIER